jgi:hypothetical protein
MKKLICILLFAFVNVSYANYIVTGSGDNKGEAYINAMSQAPSGSHWEISSIYYSPNSSTCIIIWKIKK